MSKFISLRTCIKIYCGDSRGALESFFKNGFPLRDYADILGNVCVISIK